jgi:hypothetical protein
MNHTNTVEGKEMSRPLRNPVREDKISSIESP